MNEKIIWNFLKGKGLNDYAVAGIMGNLYAESGLIPNNLQQTFNASLGMSDEQYTTAIDTGSYTNFVYDQAGYGLAQWTYYTRKQGLLEHARKTKRSVGDLQVQLEYIWDELQDFSAVLQELANVQSVRAASNIILNEYEIPYDRSEAVQNARAEYSQQYYNLFANTNNITDPIIMPAPKNQEVYCVVGLAKVHDIETAREIKTKLKDLGFETAFITKAEI